MLADRISPGGGGTYLMGSSSYSVLDDSVLDDSVLDNSLPTNVLRKDALPDDPLPDFLRKNFFFLPKIFLLGNSPPDDSSPSAGILYPEPSPAGSAGSSSSDPRRPRDLRVGDGERLPCGDRRLGSMAASRIGTG
jgi:hypothetical protein